jgi:hypothetical protein
MWLGNVLMLAVGIVLAARMGRMTGNTRGGGGLDDLLARVGAAFRPRPRRPAAVERAESVG